MSDGTYDGEFTMRFERRLAHPPERVWAALTEPALIEGWLGRAEGRVAAGETVAITWLNGGEEAEASVMTAEVTDLEPHRTLVLTGDIHGRLRFELTPEADGRTRLIFTVLMHPETLGEVSLFLAGWHIHLDHLEETLAGDPVDWSRWGAVHRPRWDALHEQYLAAP